jgi:hypothetical protein
MQWWDGHARFTARAAGDVRATHAVVAAEKEREVNGAYAASSYVGVRDPNIISDITRLQRRLCIHPPEEVLTANHNVIRNS